MQVGLGKSCKSFENVALIETLAAHFMLNNYYNCIQNAKNNYCPFTFIVC